MQQSLSEKFQIICRHHGPILSPAFCIFSPDLYTDYVWRQLPPLSSPSHTCITYAHHFQGHWSVTEQLTYQTSAVKHANPGLLNQQEEKNIGCGWNLLICYIWCVQWTAACGPQHPGDTGSTRAGSLMSLPSQFNFKLHIALTQILIMQSLKHMTDMLSWKVKNR